MDQTDFLAQAPCFQIKGSMIALTTLELISNQPELLDAQLAHHIAQSPGFFHDTPIILALDKRMDPAIELELPAILSIFKQHQLHIMAIRAERESDIQAAQSVGLPVLPPSIAKERPLPAIKQPANDTPRPQPALIVDTPVRSGQQVYAKDCDLIVLAAVSAGAELLADGNIHVYGALRGRALAGINGNHQARIFCQQMSAELISIAGQYKIAEDLRGQPYWGNAAQICLQDQHMIIQAM